METIMYQVFPNPPQDELPELRFSGLSAGRMGDSQPEKTHNSHQTVTKKIVLEGAKVQYILQVLFRFSLNKNEA